MKLVQRKNEVLKIPDDAVDSYLENGYNLLDNSGKYVVQEGKKETYSYAEHKALKEQLEAVKKENEKLKRENEALKGEKGSAKKAE